MKYSWRHRGPTGRVLRASPLPPPHGISDDEIVAGMSSPGFKALATMRAGVGMYNNEDEVDTLVKAVKEMAVA